MTDPFKKLLDKMDYYPALSALLIFDAIFWVRGIILLMGSFAIKFVGAHQRSLQQAYRGLPTVTAVSLFSELGSRLELLISNILSLADKNVLFFVPCKK